MYSRRRSFGSEETDNLSSDFSGSWVPQHKLRGLLSRLVRVRLSLSFFRFFLFERGTGRLELFVGRVVGNA